MGSKFFKKKANNYTIIVLLLVVLLILVFIPNGFLSKYHQYEMVEDKSNGYPLGENHIYYIERNVGDPSNVFYTIIPMPELDRERFDYLDGRKIGEKTTLDLEGYLGKPVYIDGSFYWGKPKLLSDIPEDHWLNNKTVVLEIDNVTVVTTI